MAQITQQKNSGAGFVALSSAAESEAVPFTGVAAGATVKVRLQTDEVFEHSLGFVAVHPGARIYTVQIWEDLPAPFGLCLRYTLTRAGSDTTAGQILIPDTVSFRYPIEIHVINGEATPQSFLITYRLFDRIRIGSY